MQFGHYQQRDSAWTTSFPWPPDTRIPATHHLQPVLVIAQTNQFLQVFASDWWCPSSAEFEQMPAFSSHYKWLQLSDRWVEVSGSTSLNGFCLIDYQRFCYKSFICKINFRTHWKISCLCAYVCICACMCVCTGAEAWSVTRREEGQGCGRYGGVSLKDKNFKEWGHQKDAGGVMHYWQNARGQIAMVWSCDEKGGWKLLEKNYDSRGQWTPQPRTTEEVMRRQRQSYSKGWSLSD